MTKFEVGKKYRYIAGYAGIELCLAVTDDLAWLQPVAGGRGSIVDRVHSGWVEYKEPRKIEAWVNVYESRGKLEFGRTHKTKEEALSAAAKHVIDTIKITWTEGE